MGPGRQSPVPDLATSFQPAGDRAAAGGVRRQSSAPARRCSQARNIGAHTSGPSDRPRRSEEHTSESSHSQISYAVFCLKKKKLPLERVALDVHFEKLGIDSIMTLSLTAEMDASVCSLPKTLYFTPRNIDVLVHVLWTPV